MTNLSRSILSITLFLVFAMNLCGQEWRVVGYLPEYRSEQIREVWFKQLTDLMLFSAEVKSNGMLDLNRVSKLPIERIVKLAKPNSTRIILCIGGWGRSEHFASVTAESSSRSTLVKSVLETCFKLGLNGVDLDWEHPKSKKEETNYGLLLKDLAEAFKPHSLQLSITMAAWQSIPTEAFASTDFVQVMAYDHEGRHSTFEGAIQDLERVAALGVPKSKIILGIPLYGRSIKDRQDSKTYQEIVSLHSVKPEIDEVDGYYFNGLKTIQKKCDHAANSGLAGIMFWELAQDATGDASVLDNLSDRSKRADR